MDKKIIEKLNNKELRSLTVSNLIIFSLFFILICGFFLSCDMSQEDYKKMVNDFKSGKEITCKDTFISKQRGWSIDKSEHRFIKGDNFMEIKLCLRGY